MSNHTALPARQHISVSLHGEHHDDYLNGDPSSSQETSGPPPSYTATDAFRPFEPDVKQALTDVEGITSLADGPAQLPFDDLTGGFAGQRSLAVPRHQHPESLGSPLANLRPESQTNSGSHGTQPTRQQQPPDFPYAHAHAQFESAHTPRSAPDTRKALGKISEFEEANMYRNALHDESPFEAARRAQRTAVRDAIKPLSGQAHTTGRFPSIRPGEIMPRDAMQPIKGPPSFFPPLEAPPFPPTVHTPIRPAHYPPSLHPSPQIPEPTRLLAHHQPPMPQAPQPTRSHSSHSHHAPSPPRPVPPVPLNPNPTHSHGQPPREPLRSHSQPIVPHPLPPQPIRFYSHQNTQPPHSLPQEYSNTPSPSRRHTFNAREGVPPGLAPNGHYLVPQPLPPIPHGQPSPLHHQAPPPGPPSRSQSQHQPHRHTPPPSALRDTRHQSLTAQPPSRIQLAAPVPTPVRLPSQNVRTPPALGVVHSPPTSSGSPRPDNSRPPRLTPKPVMPQLLAPLVTQEPNLGRLGPGLLQRSTSSAAIGGEKGGFLAKTKSILRKRTSATGIRTHADGAITFAPTMPNLMEENSAERKKPGKRLSRKK